MFVRLLILSFILLSCRACAQTGIFEVMESTVKFSSETRQELINASSEALQGVIDMDKKVFAFKISINTFFGFNSPLQREHFNENYMESSIFPEASYTGKIIEDIDYHKDGTYTVRTKGKLKIHGVEQEQIIKAVITIKGNTITITSGFMMLLADYNIKIPRIVSNKLSSQIAVSVKAMLHQR